MKNFFLIFIIIVAAAFRFYQLGQLPAGLNADEAALGYNAYSLLLTGKDEHGHPWPVNLESFGDYKPAFYSYILIPFVKLLGLTPLAVRLPSAIAGVALVYVVYLLGKQLFSPRIGLFAAASLSIMPWAVHFSRGAWEVNVATFFITLGVYFFINRRILLSLLFLILSMYTYQSARLIAPLIGLGIFITNFSFFSSDWKRTIRWLGFSLILLLPFILSLFSSSTASRLAGVGLLSDMGPQNRNNELRGQHSTSSVLLAKILHNKPVSYGLAFLKNYTDHYSGEFLFVTGDLVERSKIPGLGQLYLLDLFWLSCGIYCVIRTGKNNPLIWWWLAIAPLASALTFQTPSALRSQNMIVPLSLLIGVGLNRVFSTRRILFGVVISAIFIWEGLYFWRQYSFDYPYIYPAAWQYGFAQLVPYVESVKDRYNQVLITDKYDQPYILFLFYSQYPPRLFQGQHELSFRDKFNFSTVRSYANYRFTSTPWEKVRDIHSTLIVASPEDIPPVGVNIVKTIYFPNGSPAFKIVSN